MAVGLPNILWVEYFMPDNPLLAFKEQLFAGPHIAEEVRADGVHLRAPSALAVKIDLQSIKFAGVVDYLFAGWFLRRVVLSMVPSRRNHFFDRCSRRNDRGPCYRFDLVWILPLGERQLRHHDRHRRILSGTFNDLDRGFSGSRDRSRAV